MPRSQRYAGWSFNSAYATSWPARAEWLLSFELGPTYMWWLQVLRVAAVMSMSAGNAAEGCGGRWSMRATTCPSAGVAHAAAPRSLHPWPVTACQSSSQTALWLPGSHMAIPLLTGTGISISPPNIIQAQAVISSTRLSPGQSVECQTKPYCAGTRSGLALGMQGLTHCLKH